MDLCFGSSFGDLVRRSEKEWLQHNGNEKHLPKGSRTPGMNASAGGRTQSSSPLSPPA